MNINDDAYGDLRSATPEFETMVFGGKHDQDQWRYPTWDEAVAGHDRVVDKLAWRCLSPLVQWLRQFKAYWSD